MAVKYWNAFVQWSFTCWSWDVTLPPLHVAHCASDTNRKQQQARLPGPGSVRAQTGSGAKDWRWAAGRARLPAPSVQLETLLSGCAPDAQDRGESGQIFSFRFEVQKSHFIFYSFLLISTFNYWPEKDDRLPRVQKSRYLENSNRVPVTSGAGVWPGSLAKGVTFLWRLCRFQPFISSLPFTAKKCVILKVHIFPIFRPLFFTLDSSGGASHDQLS